MYKVFGKVRSGNCYKVKLLLEQLQHPYQWYDIDTLKGESRTKEFLEMNPNGKIPVIEISPGKYLPESNAILCYLADGTAFWPTDRFEKADTLNWMFFEQYSHEPYLAVARFISKFLPPDSPRKAELPKLQERGYQALAVMEKHLSNKRFFVSDQYSIADIALFAYTHTAKEGGFDLASFPAVNQWLKRVEAQPRFIQQI